jgi:predicted nucleotidyltransferase
MISEEQIRIYNKTLEPNIWSEDKTLKSDIRLYFLKIAKDFYTSTDFKSEILDILMLGSSVNYTWTKESDIDIHIVIDITKEGLDPEHFRKFLDSIGGKFNDEHNITIKGHKVEVYLQDITEKNSTPEKARAHGAMFSLLHNKWLVLPKNEQPVLDKDAIKKSFYKIKGQIDKVRETRNIEGLKELMKSIRDYRNKGLESKEGEFSIENIVFKALRHTGILEKLKDSINSMYDRLVSLEEMESYLNKLNNLDEDIVHELIEETIGYLEEKDKSYTIIGVVDSRPKITIIKSEKINGKPSSYKPYKFYPVLYCEEHDIDPNTAIYWRYRSDINELMHYDYLSEVQSIAVKEYLKNNCKLIESLRVVMSEELNRTHRRSLHDLDYQYKGR